MSVIYLGYHSQECDVFNVKPRRIYLHFDLPRKETLDKSFIITNKTTQQQMVTFDYPITKFFEIPRFKDEQLTILPEKSLEVPVKCRGKLEARPYYDTIKVMCSKGCGTYVRLSASPTIREKMKIPFDINLGTVPLGETEMITNKEEKTKSKFKMKLPFVRVAQSDDKMTIPPKNSDWSHHKTNLFLLKKDGKKDPEFDLLGPLGRPLKEEEATKRKKQLSFFKDLIAFRKSCLEPLGHNRTVLKQLIVDDHAEWDSHWDVYEEILFERGKCDKDMKLPVFRRQRLLKSPVLEEDYSYSVELPNLWFIRRQILNKFIEAVRRIVIYNRLLTHLSMLKMVCLRQKASIKTVRQLSIA